MSFDLDQSLREIMTGLEGLRAEGREAEADIRKWTEIARKAKDLVAPSRPATEPAPPPQGPPAPVPAVVPVPAPASAPDALACVSCATPLKATAKFCAKCGTKVERKAVAKPLVCAACGGPLTERTRFCGTCGTAVSRPGDPSRPAS